MTNTEIIKQSKEVYELKQNLTKNDTAIPNYIDSIQNLFNKDNIYRQKFIQNNSFIAGATLEFRNIYGIEAPYYGINNNCYMWLDKDGDGSFSYSKNSNDYGEFIPTESVTTVETLSEMKELTEDDISLNSFVYVSNERKYYKAVTKSSGSIKGNSFDFNVTTECLFYSDCDEIINASKFDEDILPKRLAWIGGVAKYPAKYGDYQRFFVDSKKYEEGSSFYHPFNIPGMNKWCANFLNPYICKKTVITEKDVYNILNGQASTISNSFSISGLSNGSTFSASTPFEYDMEPNGNYTKNSYIFSYDDETLSTYESTGKNTYEIKNPQVINSLSPYSTSSSNFSTSVSSGNYLAYYQLKLRNLPYTVFNSGYCILSLDPNDRSKFYTNILTTSSGAWYQKSVLVAVVQLVVKVINWFRKLFKQPAITFKLDMKPFNAYFSPVTNVNDSVKRQILGFYQNLLKAPIQMYNTYLTEVNSDTVKELNLSNSLSSMQTLYSKISTYLSNPTDYNKAQVTSALSKRMEIIYTDSAGNIQPYSTIPAPRASAINKYMQEHQTLYTNLYNSLDARINKRSGTLRQLFKTIKNSNIILSNAGDEKTNYVGLTDKMAVYPISSGFGSKEIVVSSESWEDYDSIPRNIPRKSTVYVVADNNTCFSALVTDVEEYIVADSSTSSTTAQLKSAQNSGAKEGKKYKLVLTNISPEQTLSISDYTPRVVVIK